MGVLRCVRDWETMASFLVPKALHPVVASVWLRDCAVGTVGTWFLHSLTEMLLCVYCRKNWVRVPPPGRAAVLVDIVTSLHSVILTTGYASTLVEWGAVDRWEGTTSRVFYYAAQAHLVMALYEVAACVMADKVWFPAVFTGHFHA